MASRRRADCPVCKRNISVRKDGTLTLHGGAHNPYGRNYCDGSEKKVLDSRTPVDRGVQAR